MMSHLNGKHILLGVTGGIAAYKSAELVRLLKKSGAEVQVLMSAGAQAFITPLTLQTLSENPVCYEGGGRESTMAHIDFARWADLVLVAPATAHFLAKLTAGFADDVITTLCLATSAPIVVAPAMNSHMWLNAATQANVALLQQRNIGFIGPGHGIQACGETGVGRMLEPAAIVEELQTVFATSKRWQGKTVLITAGPTQEALDPVRHLSNYSSGKMGYALAEAAYAQGASVILISGPTALRCSTGIERVDVLSAAEMMAAVMLHVDRSDIFIAAAAVADYRVAAIPSQKMKKTTATLSLELIRNPDIVAAVAALEKRPWVVGFAAETENLLANARTKLITKKLDMIIANEVGLQQGFQVDENACVVLCREQTWPFARMAKKQLAHLLIDLMRQEIKD